MNNLEVFVEGNIHAMPEPTTIGSQGKTKRQVTVKVSGQYDQYPTVDFLGGQCEDQLKDYQVGDKIKITAYLGGREYTKEGEATKYFNSVNGSKVEGNPTGF